MANTTIQIKHSTATAAPTILSIGELGYSYAGGGNLFIGNTASTGVIQLPIGNTGVVAATYGGPTQVPTFTVDSKGRITSAANVSISAAATITAAGNTGSGTFSSTANVKGGGSGGITTNFTDADDTFYVSVDSTVIRTSATTQTISGELILNGNLIVNQITSQTSIINTTTLQTNDSLIELANNNVGAGAAGDVLDIGFYGTANVNAGVSGSANTPSYIGLVRQAAGDFFLFKNIFTNPSLNVLSSGSVTAQNTATLRANLTGGTVTSLAAAILVNSGGTGFTSYTANGVIFGGITSTSPLLSVASSTEGHLLTINTTGIPTFAMLQGGTF